MHADVMQSLWIGPRLSAMEQLAIRSFLYHGHPFHLYTYAPVEGIPSGVVLKDANEIIPQKDIFLVRGGYSSFSDFFRWKLVLEKGGWWVDVDAVCLRPFDFGSDYIFIGGQGLPGSADCITSGLFKAPKGSEIMQWGWDACKHMNVSTMAWGQAGPPLFTEAVHRFGFQKQIVPGRLFFPIFYSDAPQVFLKPEAPSIPEDAYSVHLFNEIWRLALMNKDGVYSETSLYELLKRRFNGNR